MIPSKLYLPLHIFPVEYNHIHTRDPLCFFCLHHPQQINTLVNQHAQQPQELLSNDGITTVNDVVNVSRIKIEDKFMHVHMFRNLRCKWFRASEL